MIEMNEMTQRYGPAAAVDGLTFTVRPAQVTGFPGAGEPTTLRDR